MPLLGLQSYGDGKYGDDMPHVINGALTHLTIGMCTAMEILGLHCWHSFSFLSTNYGDVEMWQDAIDRKFFAKGPSFGREEFDQLLHNYGAVSSDTPAIAFSEELVVAYP